MFSHSEEPISNLFGKLEIIFNTFDNIHHGKALKYLHKVKLKISELSYASLDISEGRYKYFKY